jgi:hypothetical protein
MKKHKLLLLTLFFPVFYSNAAIYRVNNQAGVDADFTSIVSAVNAAANGDILLIEGSPIEYGGVVGLNKRLTIIGPGNFLTNNPNTQAYPYSATFSGQFYFENGSDNSIVMGIYFYRGTNNGTQMTINGADNITLRRNRFYTDPSSTSTLYIAGGSYGILIEQNWMASVVQWQGGPLISIASPCSVTIRNNFINHGVYYGYAIITVNDGNNLITIQNNLIQGTFVAYYSAIFNNIYWNGNFTNGSGNIVAYNLCSGTQFPAGNGNVQNVNMNTVFVNNGGSVDNNYELAPGSPAIGAGAGGGDCGMYSADSGGNPYVLSTMPPVPSITSVSMPPIATTTLPVTIQAVSHN